VALGTVLCYGLVCMNQLSTAGKSSVKVWRNILEHLLSLNPCMHSL
jgi:hypothetical protein